MWRMRTVLPLIAVAALAPAARAEGELDAIAQAVPACDPARAHCFGLEVHVTVGEHGPIATPAWLAAQVAEANRQFAPIGVGWQLAGIGPLPAAAARVADREARDAFAPQVAGAVIHVFVTARLDDIDQDGEEIRGVTWRRGDAKYVILSTIAMDLVLAHELGHVFGLPHSRYAISLMNKTKRAKPAPADRRFAGEELPIMRETLARLLKQKRLADQPAPARSVDR